MLALIWLISGSFVVMFSLPAFLFTYLSLEPHLRAAAASKGKLWPSEARPSLA